MCIYIYIYMYMYLERERAKRYVCMSIKHLVSTNKQRMLFGGPPSARPKPWRRPEIYHNILVNIK